MLKRLVRLTIWAIMLPAVLGLILLWKFADWVFDKPGDDYWREYCRLRDLA